MECIEVNEHCFQINKYGTLYIRHNEESYEMEKVDEKKDKGYNGLRWHVSQNDRRKVEKKCQNGEYKRVKGSPHG